MQSLTIDKIERSLLSGIISLHIPYIALSIVLYAQQVEIGTKLGYHFPTGGLSPLPATMEHMDELEHHVLEITSGFVSEVLYSTWWEKWIFVRKLQHTTNRGQANISQENQPVDGLKMQ